MPDDRPIGDLTWPALLAHWTAFARSSVALPKNAEGDRWRAAVAPIIGLQAVAFALGDLDRLDESPGATGDTEPDGERALALDKAEILINQHAGELARLWPGEPLHPELASLVADARAALQLARHGGLEWSVRTDRLVAEHPAELVEALLTSEPPFAGDLLLPVPGVPLFASSPAAFIRGRHGGPPGGEAEAAITGFLGGKREVSGPQPSPGPRQVYRQFDFAKGGPVRDLVMPLAGAAPPGQPLLLFAIRAGEPQPVPLPMARASRELPDLPVEFG